MNIKLTVDYRENKIIEKLKNTEIDFEMCIENLPIGDFIISKNDIIKLIIERKTFSDLASSIIDGRFREQKNRLIESDSNILYILEGQKNKTKMDGPCNGAIQNLLFKHKINVLHTRDLQDTIDNILMMNKKIRNNEILEESNNKNQIQPKIFSKSDKIKSSIFMLQLCVIPGV